MAKVVGVRFRNVGKIYYFNPKNYKVKPGDHVIVETARGVEYGKVVLAPKDVVDDQVVHPLKEVLRVATKDDDEREKYNRERERDAFKICQAEFCIDNTHITHRIHSTFDMCDIPAFKAAYDMSDRIGFPDVAEELVSKAFTFRCPCDEPCNIDKTGKSRCNLFRIEHFCQIVNTMIWYFYYTYVWFNRTEREVCSFCSGFRDRIK